MWCSSNVVRPLLTHSSNLTQARQLLKEASEGLNPFEGFTPKLADGESLAFGTEEFDKMEAAGLEAAAKTAFVLVRDRPAWCCSEWCLEFGT